jgi:hypothetical protein
MYGLVAVIPLPRFAGGIMFKKSIIRVALALAVAAVLATGCSLVNAASTDAIVGTWQQSPSLGTTLQFSESPNTYIYTTGVIQTNSGSWTKSGNTYVLTGAILGIVGTSSTITPVFSNSNKTFTYVDSSSIVEVYNKE